MSNQFSLDTFTDAYRQYLEDAGHISLGVPYTIVVEKNTDDNKYNCKFSYISKDNTNYNFEFSFEYRYGDYHADVESVEYYNVNNLFYMDHHPRLSVIASDAKTIFSLICEHKYVVE